MSGAIPVRFRWSEAADIAAIRAVHADAFGQSEEADLAEALLADDVETLSIVADLDGAIVGHIMLSALGGPDRALALAPLAVASYCQRCGIGGELMRLSLKRARERGWRSVFVLGDPAYYQRFGFSAETAKGARCPWQGPHFMAMELEEGALSGFAGDLRYAAPFDAL